ncbi:DNA polymerase III subunit beta [Hassallia byssoidea VB512170]|uniref:DNA polymerase III subunit beta n=1 Tax=Hassallia byssoidea VB512170 TaxID=1304833 RepID=A0A846H536_9CYAN|nr:DNA polymerase III subunit beta [Hassalia byssoidea]NEU71734.1 DNA polymerase III subunit beta [Hassalia byssoidea VB512170]
MKLTIEQSTLQELIETTKNAVAAKPTDVILGNLLITASAERKLTAIGTNLNLSIESTIEASIENAGSAALPAKLLVDTVSNLKGQLTIEVNNRTCVIHHSTGKCRIQGGNPEEFPSLPESSNAIIITIPCKKLQAAMDATLYCSSSDETKLVLTGVNFQFHNTSWQAATTDGHRLALVSGSLDTDYPTPIEFTVPAKSLVELNKILAQTAENSTCDILVEEKTVRFVLANAKITSRLLEGDYPHINNLIPKSFAHKFTLERKAFEMSLKRIAHFTERKQKIVKIVWEVSNGQATLFTEASDIGDAVDSLLMKPYSSSTVDINIGLNIQYLQEALRHILTDEVIIQCNNSLQPVVICPVGGLLNQLSLIMPVEIKQEFSSIPTTSKQTQENDTDKFSESSEPKGIQEKEEHRAQSPELPDLTNAQEIEEHSPPVEEALNDTATEPETPTLNTSSKSRKRNQKPVAAV